MKTREKIIKESLSLFNETTFESSTTNLIAKKSEYSGHKIFVNKFRYGVFQQILQPFFFNNHIQDPIRKPSPPQAHSGAGTPAKRTSV